jgi:4-diphosphocytidyl-2-C-methyl-D-erythritol kinase
LNARAYAKINVGLEVLFRREDGYHELRTIFQTIDMYDRLSFQPAEKGVALVTSDPELSTGRDNLVVRAAEILAERIECSKGVRIELEKTIPAGRGLGGGSADAAMTLLALNELWQGDLSEAELRKLARGIGMDVPYFLVGGTALGLGRGEEIFPLEFQFEVPIVLILPDFAVSTAEAYRNLILTKRETSLKLQDFALSCLGGRGMSLDLVNDLESSTTVFSPAIHEYKASLTELGAAVALMSGSGSSVFGVFYNDAVARSAAESLAARGTCAIATRTSARRTYLERRLESRPRRTRES